MGVYLTHQLNKELKMVQAFNADKSPLAKWLKSYRKELSLARFLQDSLRAAKKRKETSGLGEIELAIKESKDRISSLKGGNHFGLESLC